jgi:hypothetical protein
MLYTGAYRFFGIFTRKHRPFEISFIHDFTYKNFTYNNYDKFEHVSLTKIASNRTKIMMQMNRNKLNNYYGNYIA